MIWQWLRDFRHSELGSDIVTAPPLLVSTPVTAGPLHAVPLPVAEGHLNRTEIIARNINLYNIKALPEGISIVPKAEADRVDQDLHHKPLVGSEVTALEVVLTSVYAVQWTPAWDSQCLRVLVCNRHIDLIEL